MNARILLVCILGIALVGLALAQGPMIGVPQNGGLDLGAAGKSRPTRSGSSLPGSCETGELFFRTGVTAGLNLYGCTAANAWTLLGDGTSGGGGGSRFPVSLSLGGYAVLTNVGTSYDAVNPSKGLGFAELDFTGSTSMTFTVFVNKIGSGTQSWQLYNETAGAELAVIDDTGGAGDKLLTVTISSGLPTGVARVRVRAKSTTAADDPVFYGASLKLD